MIELRPYQQDALDAVMAYWAKGGGNALVDLATGLGKSVIIAKLIQDCLTNYPDMRIINLVHVRELVQQNYLALMRLWPQARAGIFSAGLGKRDTHRPILFASIQSVFRQDGYSLGHQDLVLIDEAHLVPGAGEGMYRKFLDNLRRSSPDLRVAGFTATPFRMDSGRLDEGKDRLFDEIVYSYGIRDGIENGFLSPLISKATLVLLSVAGVAKQGGEFVGKALEAAVDIDSLTKAAVSELAELGADRRSWLIFCAGVKHAHHVAEAIRALGISCQTITGETPTHERTRAIADFKAGRIRALTNANVLTTGFDAPGVDLIGMLRPTLSTGLYVQMIGRGTRLADGKPNCLVLDFAGNVRRHGPVDLIEIVQTKGSGKEAATVKEDSVRAKECPTCHSLVPINAGVCPDCGHEWPVEDKPKHEAHADAETPILATEDMLSRKAKKLLPEEHPVVGWEARRHEKEGSPASMCVTYFAGLLSFREWVCLEHGGFAGNKARRWWLQHYPGWDSEGVPTVDEGVRMFAELRRPDVILTRKSGQWWEIVGRRFDQGQVEEAAA
jgi:DNA repair protein RadD